MLSGTQHFGPIAASMVRVLDLTGQAVGAGFVVGPRQVATCAHVVCAILGGSPEDRVGPPGRLRVDLPLLDITFRCDALVQTWHPIEPETGRGDVAILELVDELPAVARVPPLHRPDRLWGHRFRVLGFPAGMQDGVWTTGELRDRQGTRWLQLQSDPHSTPLVGGFSGAPVWDEEVEAVVGMAVAADRWPESTTAYLLPIEDVLGVDPRLLPNPYRGLEPFGEEHADVFYGRDDEVARLETLLDHQSIVAVVGRSGTGKSSLVRAGLVPRLRRRGVHVVELRLGMADDSPTVALDRIADDLEALVGDGSDRGVVLFADQFEELVGTQPPGDGPTPGQHVLRRLADMVGRAPRRSDGSRSLRAVLTLRWEAMNELLTDDVVETFDRGTLSLASMSRDQLRRAIVGPATGAPGLDFEAGLVERILDDAVAEPGQLPLVESLLAQLWESRDAATLRVAAYERLGGVRGAVARMAEEAVDEIASPDDVAIRRLLTMLVRADDSGDLIRRPARLEAMTPEQRGLVEDLARHRLLVVGQGADDSHMVELTHQALIDHWPRLRRWLDEDRDFLVWQQEIDRQHAAWERSGRDEGALLRGVALVRAKEWLERRGHDLPSPTWAFVDASRHRERRAARRRRTALSAGVAVLAVLLVLATTLVYQRRDAQQEAAISASRGLAALAADTATSDPELSMLAALAAYQSAPTPEAESALFRRYVDYGEAEIETVLSGAAQAGSPDSVVDALDLDASRDGRVIAGRSSQGTATVWVRSATGEYGRHRVPGEVMAMDVADDGRTIVLLRPGRVTRYDVEERGDRWHLADPDEEVVDVLAGPDGQVAVLRSRTAPERNLVELWEPSRDGSPALVGELGLPWAHLAGFGPEPGTVVLETGPDDAQSPLRLLLWDAATGAAHTLDDDVEGLVPVSADGATAVALTCPDVAPPTISVFDLQGRTERSMPVPAEVLCSAEIALDPEGDLALVGSTSVDLVTGRSHPQPALPATGTVPEGQVLVRRDRRVLAVGAGAAHVVVTEVRRDAPESPTLSQVALTPNGRHLVGVTDDGQSIAVHEAGPDGFGRRVAEVPRPQPQWVSTNVELAVSHDGRFVADRVAPDRVQVRRLDGLELVSEVTTDPVPDDPDEELLADELTESGVAFSDGRLFAHSGTHAEWWDPASGEKVGDVDVAELGLVEQDDQDGVSFAPLRGDRVAVAVADQTALVVLDIRSGRRLDEIQVLLDGIGLMAQDASPYVLLFRSHGLVELWDLDAGRRVLGPLGGLPNSRNGFTTRFLDDPGRFLLVDSGVLRVYQAGSLVPQRTLQFADDDRADDLIPLSVSADGRTLLYANLSTGWARNLSLSPADWQDAVCDALGRREFTDQEQATLPDAAPARPSC